MNCSRSNGLRPPGATSVALLLALGACAPKPEQSPPVDNSLSRLASKPGPVAEGPSRIPPGGDPLSDEVRRIAEALQAASDAAATREPPPPAADPPSEPEPTSLSRAGDPLEPESVPEPGLEARIARAAEELRLLLSERASSGARFVDAVACAALEPVLPGAADGPVQADLSASEQEALAALAIVFRGAAADGGRSDPGAAADLLEEARASLDGHLNLRIAAAELCTEVAGFGQYTPLPNGALQALRGRRVVVYTEVERFAHRAVAEVNLGSHKPSPGDRWAVELMQELRLYNETGQINVWARPGLPVVETSRARRRDFHIVDVIELPPNLTIGDYRLHVTVRDRATGAEDRRIIPLRVVADPRLASGQ